MVAQQAPTLSPLSIVTGGRMTSRKTLIAQAKTATVAKREEERVKRLARYHAAHVQEMEKLRVPDDDRVRFMRTPWMATDLGMARSTVIHAVNPGMARHLDAVWLEGKDPITPPPPPRDETVRQLLRGALHHPFALASARLTLYDAAPDHSFVLEVKGFLLLCSEHDLARAKNQPNWSQSMVSRRKTEAASWVRDLTFAIVDDNTVGIARVIALMHDD